MEKLNLKKIYKGRWFASRHKMNWRTQPFCDAVWNTLGPFKSVVDLGCAIGEFIAYFQKAYKVPFAVGFEGTDNCLDYKVPEAKVYIHDLREPLKWVGKFDLCMCVEVAEHIEPEFADALVDNCCVMSDLILFTAAPPGQEGLSHVNLQHPDYWYDKFKARGYTYQSDKVIGLKNLLENLKHKKGIKAYYDNAMVFENGHHNNSL